MTNLNDPNLTTATTFNGDVWNSSEMAEANEAIEAAGLELAQKGWGLFALRRAKAELQRAIRLIDEMDPRA